MPGCDRESLLSYPVDIDAHKFLDGNDFKPAVVERQSRSLQSCQVATRNADVHSFGLDMHATLSDACRVFPKIPLGGWRSAPADRVERLTLFELPIERMWQVEKLEVDGLHGDSFSSIAQNNTLRLLQVRRDLDSF